MGTVALYQQSLFSMYVGPQPIETHLRFLLSW